MLSFTVHPDGTLARIIPTEADLGVYLKEASACGCTLVNRNDFKTFADAEAMAEQCNEHTTYQGRVFIATDSGPYVSPRYDVIEMVKVGDEVSRGFNGDYYPCGKVTKITHNLRRVETDDGTIFWRRRLTGAWVEQSGCFGMVKGVHRELNPSF